MKAADILNDKGRRVVSVSPEDSLADAIGQLAEHNIGVVVVTEGERLVGILSERDVVRSLAGAPTGFRETTVASLMTADPLTAGEEAGVDELLDLMTAKRIRHVPIVSAGRLAGILSIGDVVKHRVREVQAEAEALKSYISS